MKLIVITLFSLIREALSQFDCKTNFLNAYNIDGSTGPRFKPMLLCQNVLISCCTEFDEMKFHKNWYNYYEPKLKVTIDKVSKKYFKPLPEHWQPFAKFDLIKYKDLLNEGKQEAATKLLEKIKASTLDKKMRPFQSQWPLIRDYEIQAKRNFICVLCDQRNHESFESENKRLLFKASSCESLLSPYANMLQYRTLIYNKNLLQHHKLIRMFNSTYFFKENFDLIADVRRNAELVKKCFPSETAVYNHANCTEICNKYMITSLSPMFHGELPFYDYMEELFTKFDKWIKSAMKGSGAKSATSPQGGASNSTNATNTTGTTKPKRKLMFISRSHRRTGRMLASTRKIASQIKKVKRNLKKYQKMVGKMKKYNKHVLKKMYRKTKQLVKRNQPATSPLAVPVPMQQFAPIPHYMPIIPFQRPVIPLRQRYRPRVAHHIRPKRHLRHLEKHHRRSHRAKRNNYLRIDRRISRINQHKRSQPLQKWRSRQRRSLSRNDGRKSNPFAGEGTSVDMSGGTSEGMSGDTSGGTSGPVSEGTGNKNPTANATAANKNPTANASATNKNATANASAANKNSTANASAANKNPTANASAANKNSTANASAANKNSTANPSATNKNVTASATATNKNATTNGTATNKNATANATAANKNATANATATNKNATANATAANKNATANATAANKNATANTTNNATKGTNLTTGTNIATETKTTNSTNITKSPQNSDNPNKSPNATLTGQNSTVKMTNTNASANNTGKKNDTDKEKNKDATNSVPKVFSKEKLLEYYSGDQAKVESGENLRCESCKNSKWAINSEKIVNSNYTLLSKGVSNSTYVVGSQNVSNSYNVTDSVGVHDSRDVLSSTNVTRSQKIYESSNILNSTLCSQTRNSTNCTNCTNCIACNNCTNCHNSVNVTNCVNCSNVTNSTNLRNVTNGRDLINVTNSINVTNLTFADRMENAYNASYVKNNRDCIGQKCNVTTVGAGCEGDTKKKLSEQSWAIIQKLYDSYRIGNVTEYNSSATQLDPFIYRAMDASYELTLFKAIFDDDGINSRYTPTASFASDSNPVKANAVVQLTNNAGNSSIGVESTMILQPDPNISLDIVKDINDNYNLKFLEEFNFDVRRKPISFNYVKNKTDAEQFLEAAYENYLRAEEEDPVAWQKILEQFSAKQNITVSLNSSQNASNSGANPSTTPKQRKLLKESEKRRVDRRNKELRRKQAEKRERAKRAKRRMAIKHRPKYRKVL